MKILIMKPVIAVIDGLTYDERGRPTLLYPPLPIRRHIIPEPVAEK
jgi:hypothetical protein